jgi:Zn-dependent membrane protease YugP
VQSTYAKYSKVPSRSGLTGETAGRKLLNAAGLTNIPVQKIEGELTDNYDPRDKTLHLSQSVFNSNSVAAIGVAAHEVGHAIQDSNAYFPLKLRSNIVPLANLGTTLAFPLFLLGLFASLPVLMDIGIIAFSIAVLFTIITLPVEFNASSRAVKVLSAGGIMNEDEISEVRNVLNAAALTYVAATAMAIMNLLRLLAIRNRD